MFWEFNEITEFFSDNKNMKMLSLGKWGLEKESLRITKDGELALTPHPAVFGDKTVNPFITTDFSESQVEMITPALNSIEEADDFLKYLHSVVERGIGDELLWPLSMPGILPDEEIIPSALFNNSPEGREKEIYRSGLALRYGKRMQMISGIHYNFSFSNEFWELIHQRFAPETEMRSFINDSYFALARNFLRFRWILLYLFGASPSTADKSHEDDEFRCNDIPDISNSRNRASQYATNLRMSSFGYDGGDHDMHSVSFNSMEDYLRDLRILLSTKSIKYSRYGIFQNGRQIQLNDNLLQSENEFYSPIRFKRINGVGDTNFGRLEKSGVEYIELRIFDLNPFFVTGISREQMYFVHLFILFCLFEKSNPLNGVEMSISDMNAQLTATIGRDPELSLNDMSGSFTIEKRGEEILDKLAVIAEFLDEVKGETNYMESVDSAREAIINNELLPSSWITREMKNCNESHNEFGLRRAVKNRYYFCIDEFIAAGSDVNIPVKPLQVS